MTWGKGCLGLSQTVHGTAARLCAFLPWFPSPGAWVSSTSSREHLEFWKLAQVTFHSEQVWSTPHPHPSLLSSTAIFLSKVLRKERDGGFISVMSAIQQASETGGLKNIFPVVHLCYIKPIQISLRGAGGITTPQSQCMRSFAFASSLPSGAAGPVRGPWNSEQRRQPWKWMMP